jgi:hypothetical protein
MSKLMVIAFRIPTPEQVKDGKPLSQYEQVASTAWHCLQALRAFPNDVPCPVACGVISKDVADTVAKLFEDTGRWQVSPERESQGIGDDFTYILSFSPVEKKAEAVT